MVTGLSELHYLASLLSSVNARQVLDHRMVVLMDPAKVNQEVDPLRVNRTREKRFVPTGVYPNLAAHHKTFFPYRSVELNVLIPLGVGLGTTTNVGLTPCVLRCWRQY